MKLELVNFLNNHPDDWEEVLSGAPYFLTISRDNLFGKNLVMFKYSQIESDFSNEIVKESRGLILEEKSWNIVSYPFRKFMNYGEETADDIDWNSAFISEKVDGSLIKIVRLGNDLLVSTNGTIDAFKAPIPQQMGCKYSNFGELVLDVLKEKLGYPNAHFFKESVTYMFELVSPWTRVVIPYKVADLYFLGSRNNVSLREELFTEDFLNGYFNVPKVFSFASFEDCVKNASELPWDLEGYVVCDKNFHRVKVKSLNWLSIHHMKGNDGVLSYSRALELVKTNEVSEVLSYFPEYKDEFEMLQAKYFGLVRHEEEKWQELQQKFDLQNATRKELAMWILANFQVSGVAFSLLDHKVESVEEWFQSCSLPNLCKMLGLK